MSLRQMKISDVDNVLACLSDPEVMWHYPSTYDRAQSEAWVRRVLEGYEKHGLGMWAACLKPDGEFVGQIGITPRDLEGQAELEIGYMLLRTQ